MKSQTKPRPALREADYFGLSRLDHPEVVAEMMHMAKLYGEATDRMAEQLRKDYPTK